MFSFIQLEYIVALATHGNFKVASEHCYVTQPTLSMQIKKMEQVLGVILFDRSKQPVVPTPVGVQVVEQARKILSERDRLSEIVDIHQNEIQGELQLGVIHSVAPYLLPLFIMELNLQYPRLYIHVHEMMTEDLIQALRMETIDVAILVTPVDYKQIVTRPLYYEEIAVYVSPEHPFYQLDVIPQDGLDSEEMWMLREGHCFRDQTLNLCSNKANLARNRKFTFETGSIETLIKMVDLKGGFTLIPEMVISNISPERRDRVKWIEGESKLREVSIATFRNFAKQRLIGVLENSIQSAVPASMRTQKNGRVVEWM